MDLNELTIGQAKALTSLFDCKGDQSPYQHLMGKNVIVRTVTMIYTGVLQSVHQHELVMTDVSWIPETERYMQFVETGAVRECEPYPSGLPVVIGRGALIDAVELKTSLPRSQK